MNTISPDSLLSQLPLSPKGKKGWPWTEESPALPSIMPNGNPWPKISIVTPSFNQGQFIEETIRSVLLQNYPNLEYVIIDGGSTDNSIEIIKKYEPWLTYWVSEKDKGQSHAINKGFERCTGDIFNWLCSDDILLNNAFYNVAVAMKLDAPCWLIGNAFQIDENSKYTKKETVISYFDIRCFLCWPATAIPQPAIFWNKKLKDLVGFIDEKLDYTMDIDLWFRFYTKQKPTLLNCFLSQSRLHDSAKTTPYGKYHQMFVDELAQWVLNNIYRLDDEALMPELKQGLAFLQSEMSALKRLRNHIFFGKLMKLWKILINKNFPV